MMKSILFEIDAEIARLMQAKALLSSEATVALKRKPGRPLKTAAIVVSNLQKKRKKMSAEGRERVRQAQIKRWAAVKQAATSTAKTGVAPSTTPRKKATKAAA